MLTTAWPSSVTPWLDVKFGIQVENNTEIIKLIKDIKDDPKVCLDLFGMFNMFVFFKPFKR